MSAKKVTVGMSGGVDSSVAAFLLKQAGYEVTGVYMKNWTTDMPGVRCPWAEDLSDAKRVAVQLGIPFKVYDFEAEYKQRVVDYMLREYKAGRTPNPDIMCNQEVKFKLFLETALAEGADYVATGHYARVRHTEAQAELLVGLDQNKDQSYFLCRVSQAALQKTLLPIGDFEKPEIRRIAESEVLITADKKDSQGICFVGNVGIREFLGQYVEAVPGDIIDVQTSRAIGRHDGAIFYTIGQRQGLGVGGGLPYYVTGKDMDANIVYATTKLDDPALWHSSIHLSDVHWINEPPETTREYQVRLRYRARTILAHVELAGTSATLRFNDKEKAIAAGQSAVLYDGERVVGSGIITETLAVT